MQYRVRRAITSDNIALWIAESVDENGQITELLRSAVAWPVTELINKLTGRVGLLHRRS